MEWCVGKNCSCKTLAQDLMPQNMRDLWLYDSNKRPASMAAYQPFDVGHCALGDFLEACAIQLWVMVPRFLSLC